MLFGFKVDFCWGFSTNIPYHVNQTKWCQIKAIASDYENRIKHTHTHNKNIDERKTKKEQKKEETVSREMQISNGERQNGESESWRRTKSNESVWIYKVEECLLYIVS